MLDGRDSSNYYTYVCVRKISFLKRRVDRLYISLLSLLIAQFKSTEFPFINILNILLYSSLRISEYYNSSFTRLYQLSCLQYNRVLVFYALCGRQAHHSEIVPSSCDIAEKERKECDLFHGTLSDRNYCSCTSKRSKIKRGKPLHAIASALENRILNARHLIVTQWRLLIYGGETPHKRSFFHCSTF